jgi:DNA-binding MarR family transcriptional regulator
MRPQTETGVAFGLMRVYTHTMAPCYCIVLRKASRRVTSLYDEALAPFGINLAQYSLLKNVVRHAPVSLTELGRLLDLDRSTVGRNARVMVRMGLVAMGSGEDQREQALSPTEEGSALFERATPTWHGVQDSIEQKLGEPNLTQLQALLAAI